ncbi:MAG: nuclear transport factor 2 family protein [Phycisphaerae bacterium]|nr:nuclear transport factor 2 family protein [Saprospiraceae bacterium]
MKQIKFFTLTLFFFFAALAATFSQSSTETTIRKAYAALESHDYNTFASLCADNYVELGLAPMPIKGAWNAIEQYKAFFNAFPDLKFKIGSVAPAGNNRYYLDVTVTGTNTAPFMGMPATGKSIMVHDMDIVELNAAGKCISHWSANSAGALIQIGYGSLTNPSTAVVMDVYGKFGQGDVPGILANSTEDIVFEIQDRMFDSKARSFKGKAEVGKFFQELGSKFQYTKFQPTRFVADGDDVFILIDAEYKLASTGKTYASTYTHHFKVVNGKIAYFRGVDDFQMTK